MIGIEAVWETLRRFSKHAESAKSKRDPTLTRTNDICIRRTTSLSNLLIDYTLDTEFLGFRKKKILVIAVNRYVRRSLS